MNNKNKKGNGNGDGGQKLEKQRSADSEDYSSLKTVFFYCSLIVFLPVLAFFILKGFLLDQFFNMTEMRVNIAAAVGAVVSLHIALALYIYRAYFGGVGDKKGAQHKQD